MTNPRVEKDNYDPHIVPAETAARKEREKADYKQTPVEDDSIDTEAGYTVDSEGLANNYAIEPEMYYEEPGDLRAKEEARKQARAQELHDINETDESGKLDMQHDERSKGTGKI